jgi:hypothetical protein
MRPEASVTQWVDRLKAGDPQLEKSAAKVGPTVAQKMQHWLQDTDFAGVRR